MASLWSSQRGTSRRRETVAVAMLLARASAVHLPPVQSQGVGVDGLAERFEVCLVHGLTLPRKW